MSAYSEKIERLFELKKNEFSTLDRLELNLTDVNFDNSSASLTVWLRAKHATHHLVIVFKNPRNLRIEHPKFLPWDFSLLSIREIGQQWEELHFAVSEEENNSLVFMCQDFDFYLEPCR
jgi:hypothetical protein